MRTIIHDLENLDFINLRSDDFVVNNINNKSCVGCFSCWVKTPFCCICNDLIKENGKRLFDSSELIIITKCVNGCYSYKVKQILERSISFVEPYFTIRNGEIHHKLSNGNKIRFKIFVYGKKTKNDEDLMVKLIKRNQLNLNTETPEVIFLDDINILGDIV